MDIEKKLKKLFRKSDILNKEIKISKRKTKMKGFKVKLRKTKR